MKYSFLNYNEYTLPYLTFGNGDELLFAFHGFGRSAVDFQIFELTLGKKYTIVAFDLFYHGEHAIDLEMELPAFEPSAMARIIERYLWEHKRVNFSLIGYSFGGKIALGIVQKMSHRVNEIFLLAPDGLVKKPLQFFVSNTMFGNWILSGVVRNPKWLFAVNNFMLRWKLIHPKVDEFIHSKLATIEYRRLVYRIWLTFRFYHPQLNTIAKQINRRKIRTILFFGNKDFIIPLHAGVSFQKKLRNIEALVVLDCGHRLLHKSDEIAKIILSKR